MDHRFVELRLTLQHAPVFPHCKVLESTLLSLWTACPCERELNLNHLAARCITASLAPLRRDLSLLHESTPDIRREVGQGGRCLKAWTPDVFAQCQAAGFLRGVSHRLGVGEGIQKRKVSFRTKQIWNYRSLHISQVRFQSLVGCCLVETFCCFFLWQSQNNSNRNSFGMWWRLK